MSSNGTTQNGKNRQAFPPSEDVDGVELKKLIKSSVPASSPVNGLPVTKEDSEEGKKYFSKLPTHPTCILYC